MEAISRDQEGWAGSVMEDPGGGEKDVPPLSPLHITLSQVCRMEDSQSQGEVVPVRCRMEDSQSQGEVVPMRLQAEQEKTGSSQEDAEPFRETTKPEKGGAEDSGYISREISALKSPSPLEPELDFSGGVTDMELEQNHPGDVAGMESECTYPGAVAGMALKHTQELERNHPESIADIPEDVTDLLFAEVAMEGLEDTLEMEEDGDTDETLSLENPKEASESLGSMDHHDHSNSGTIAKPQVLEEHSVVKPRVLDIIKPRLGSLLDLRVRYESARVPLRAVVGLPKRWGTEELCRLGVPLCVQDMTSHNAEDFRFSVEHFSNSALSGRSGGVCVGDGALLTLRNKLAGIPELWSAFVSSPGVDPKLISRGWFANHFKSLVTKLASMEVTHPQTFAGRCLTPDWLMLQMKYRYDREIDRAERSALHKICEHDDIPSRRMVLYVSKYCPPPHDHSRTLPNESAGDQTSASRSGCFGGGGTGEEANKEYPSVELSDGWYSLPCVLDKPLRHMIRRNKLRVGTKLMVCRAELQGLSSPSHPLDVPSSCCLKLSANSTRRARWYARLGFQSRPQPFPVPLQSLFADGGKVGCTTAVIARIYPMTYLENKDGAKTMRCQRSERRSEMLHTKERERVIEGISSRVQRDFEDEMACRGWSIERGQFLLC